MFSGGQRTKKNAENRLTVSTNKGFRRFVYDAHASLGIYVVVFLLLISLTGPVFSYGWYRAGMSKLFGQEMPPKEMKADKEKAKPTTNDNAFGQTKDDSQKKEATSPDGKKDEQGKKPKGSKLFRRFTLANGAAGSLRFYMVLPYSSVASYLSVATISGGKKEIQRRHKHPHHP